jgi:hypothetical protein
VDSPLVSLFSNGELVGQVASESDANPLKDAFAAFGLVGTFTRIDRWSAAQTPARTGRTEPSGSLARIRGGAQEQVGETAGVLAAFRNRAAMFRAARPGLARIRQARLARRASER